MHRQGRLRGLHHLPLWQPDVGLPQGVATAEAGRHTAGQGCLPVQEERRRLICAAVCPGMCCCMWCGCCLSVLRYRHRAVERPQQREGQGQLPSCGHAVCLLWCCTGAVYCGQEAQPFLAAPNPSVGRGTFARMYRLSWWWCPAPVLHAGGRCALVPATILLPELKIRPVGQYCS